MSNNHVRIVDNIEDRLYRYRAKRLRFLINGDKFFAGINYALNTEKIRSYDALLNDLTRVLMDNIKLCKGVRFIFTAEGNPVSTLTDFHDGNTYICSSIDTFIMTEYRINNGMLNWLVRNSACISSSGTAVRSKRQVNNNTTSSSNNGSCNNNSSTNSKLLLTPATKLTSHNNNNINNSNSSGNHNTSSNNISQIGNQQSKTAPTNLNTSTPLNSTTTAVKKTPKRAVDTKLSQNQKSNTLKQTKGTPTSINNNNNVNNESARKAKTGSYSPQPNSTSSKWPQTRTIFGIDVIEKYDIGRPIGDGHFSVVYCCMNKATQEFCALKLIDKLKCRGRDDMIYNEVKILKQLNHPNIVKLIEEFDYPKQLYLILELVQDGDLFDAISTVTKYNEVHVATMIHNLSSALSYLHRQGIVHRDIKPENLLISVQEDGSQSVKLADFGLAVEVGDNPLYSVCGTAFYVSPEMLTETGYDYKVDVWSTGVICFILLCGYPPFTSENESNQDELFDAILAGDFQFAPPYWSKISQHAKNLIKCMLTVDPEQRYTAEQVFKHPWTMGTSSNFEGVNPMNMSRKIAQQSQ